MTVDDLAHGVGAWLRGEGPLGDVVISSRIRLARNLKEYHFLPKADEAQRKEIHRTLTERIAATRLGDDTFFVDIDESSDLDRQVLVERHLISQQHAASDGSRGVAISAEEGRALMINEEDHLRIQVLGSGLQLSKLWTEVDEIDNILEAEVEYAFDPRLGYLTACPTNVGTGIRVSVMLHLPGLSMIQQMQRLMRAAKDMRLAVRGLYGEGTEALGDFYQLSNQTTLGKTEAEIISDFEKTIVPKIVEFEHGARETLARDHASQLDDKVYRAYSVLGNARIMGTGESLTLLSHLRMGLFMGRFADLDLGTVNEMFLHSQPAHLQKISGSILEGTERGIARADYLRRRIASNN